MVFSDVTGFPAHQLWEVSLDGLGMNSPWYQVMVWRVLASLRTAFHHMSRNYNLKSVMGDRGHTVARKS